jgi:hypothetical protein
MYAIMELCTFLCVCVFVFVSVFFGNICVGSSQNTRKVLSKTTAELGEAAAAVTSHS